MGLFDVFKKEENEEGTSRFASMERSTDAPSASEVRAAAAMPDAAPKAAGSEEAVKTAGKMISIPAITPNKLMSVADAGIIAREDAARVLGYFIEKYNAEKNPANLQSCVKNYAEAWLWVPMRMQFSPKDAAGLKAQTPNQKYVPRDPVRLVPELLKAPNGDVLYFSFTSRDEITESFMQKYVWMQMPSAHCGVFLLKHPEVAAIVINPFSKNLALKREFLTKFLKKKNEDGSETALS